MERKEFIIAIRDDEDIFQYLHRANKIICKWKKSKLGDNSYFSEFRTAEKGPILKDFKKGININNLAAYRWLYEFEVKEIEYEYRPADSLKSADADQENQGLAEGIEPETQGAV